MSGAQIAREVDAALLEVGQAVGAGEYTVTLIEPSEQPDSPWDTPADEPEEHDVRAMVSDYRPAMIDGTRIRREDKRFMISAVEHAPNVSWRIRSESVEYAIINIRRVGPSGVALYYDIQARA
jgi:hypothetical protein